MFLLKGFDTVVRFLTPDHKHSEIVVASELVPNSLQMRQFHLARAAPGCEEIQHDHPPTQIDRMKRRSINGL